MQGLSCSPAKHSLRATTVTMGMQSFSCQSWEHEDKPVFPGMLPIRKETEGTQDVLSTLSFSVEESCLQGVSPFSQLIILSLTEWDSLLKFSITPVQPLASFFHVLSMSSAVSFLACSCIEN